MSEWTERAQFLVENLDLPAASGVETARWEQFQLAHLNDDSTFRIEDKSRQIAWSFTIAAEAVAEAILDKRSSIFVSINLDEAKEKIRYARAVYENTQGVKLPKLVRDNELSLEFDNGARLLSLPSRPSRGKARMNVYLDEFAHVQHDRQIYTAALPIISKGGRLRIGSSPLGASGAHWEISRQELRPYPGFNRKITPWWEVRAFCKNVKEARHLAPALSTFERVDLFGTDTIKAIYANMPAEDFAQEYEATYVDETTAWITWDEIKAETHPELYCEIANGKDQCFQAIERLRQAVRNGTVEAAFGVGVDIGRTRNTTEIFLTGKSTLDSYPLRMMLTLDNTEFDDQFAVLCEVMTLPILKMLIDRNGIGMQLAENMEKRYPAVAEGVKFTNETKQLWATNAKMLIQQRKTPLPANRDLDYQIHSIKKTVTPSKNVVFDTERNEKHHADKFWAWVLSLDGVSQTAKSTWSDVQDLGVLENFTTPFR